MSKPRATKPGASAPKATKRGPTTPKATFVSFLLDETGSMESIKDDTVGGFNAYVEKLQQSGGDILFSLVSFNSSRTQKRYVAEPIARVRPLASGDYQPGAMTPLIDASVKIIKATAEAVAARKDDPAVVIVLQTDGQENVSVEYTTADLALLVKEKEQAGWQFVFLGAGLDAFAAAREAGLHLDAANVVAYDRAQSRQVFAATAANVAAYAASGNVAELCFSDLQRDQVGDNYTRRYLDPNAKRARPCRASPRPPRMGRRRRRPEGGRTRRPARAWTISVCRDAGSCGPGR